MKVNVLTLNEKNISDFASSRNKLLKNSNSDWNLFLDTDEQVTSNDFTVTNNYDAYYLKRINFFLGKNAGEDRIIRLVKKGSGEFKRKVHEVWYANYNNKVGIINNPYIIHNTAKDLKSYIAKMNNYSSIHAKENKNEGKNSGLFKIIIYPITKFIVTFLKTKNVVFSIMQSFHSFLAWSKLYLKSY